jgi:hypothetical protein
VANSLRLDVTAKELWAHVSTVRYRLNRFEAYTGTSLCDVEDLALIWWAFTRGRPTAEDKPAVGNTPGSDIPTFIRPKVSCHEQPT